MHYPIMLWDRNKKYCRTFMVNRKVNNISLMLNLNQSRRMAETMPSLSNNAAQPQLPARPALSSTLKPDQLNQSRPAETIDQSVFPPCDGA